MAIICYSDCNTNITGLPLQLGRGTVTISASVTVVQGAVGGALRSTGASTMLSFSTTENFSHSLGTLGMYFHIASWESTGPFFDASGGGFFRLNAPTTTTLKFTYRETDTAAIPYSVGTTHFLEVAWDNANTRIAWRIDGGSWTEKTGVSGAMPSTATIYALNVSTSNDIWLDQLLIADTYQEDIYAVRNNTYANNSRNMPMPDTFSFGGLSVFDTGSWHGEYAYMYSIGTLEAGLLDTGFRGAISTEPDNFGMPIVAASGAYSEGIDSVASAISTLTDLQTFVEAVITTAVSAATLSDALTMTETITTTGTSSAPITDAQAYIEAILSTGAGVSSLTEAVVFVEALLTTATSATSLTDQQAYVEALITTVASQTIISEAQAYLEAAQTVIAASSSISDVQSMIDNLQSVATSISSATDVQAYAEAVNSVIQSVGDITDAMTMIEALTTVAESASIITDQASGSPSETLDSVIVSASDVADYLTLFESIASICVSVSAIDAVQQFAETLATVSTGITSLSDIQSFIDTYNSTIISLSTVEDRQAYIESVLSTAASGGSVSDILHGAFVGGILRGAAVRYRLTAPQVAPRLFAEAVNHRATTAVGAQRMFDERVEHRETTVVVRRITQW